MGRYLKRKYGISEGKRTLIQVVVDQTMGTGMFFPLYFLTYEGTEALLSMRGKDNLNALPGAERALISSSTTAPQWASAWTQMRTELPIVLRTNYCIWPATNYIIFRHVPEPLRVLVSNIVSVAWNAYLCTRVANAPTEIM